MEQNSVLGRVVISKAGRDKGEYFIIIKIIKSDYVLLCNGRLRTVEKPKLKKLKHLILTDIIADEIREMILTNIEVSNSYIKGFLKSKGIFKEV